MVSSGNDASAATGAKAPTAVILCAGVGSRLRPVTNQMPKALVPVAGKPILEHQLEALRRCGVTRVTLVLGYRHGQIERHVSKAHPDLEIRTIRNAEYASTNNMYSLWLARDELKDGFVLLNGDVVLDTELLRSFLAAEPADAVAVFEGQWNAESMKVARDESTGRLTDISKEISRQEALGISLDLYRFSPQGAAAIVEAMRGFIADDGQKNLWSEVAIQRVLQDGDVPVRSVGLDDGGWVEVDTLDDLQEAEIRFNPLADSLGGRTAYFFDGDGTLYVDDAPLAGATELFKWLRDNDRRVFVVTNNSSKSKAEHAADLARMGFDLSEDEVAVSTDHTIRYLREQGHERIFVVGTPSLVGELEAAGFEIHDEAPDAVVVGFDRTLTYEKLATACLRIEEGAPFVVTHGDLVCPTQAGHIPDAGAIAALVEAATGVKPTVLGKPDGRMILDTLESIGVPPEDALMVGDRLYTDIRMGNRAGVDTVCVLTGESSWADVAVSNDRPTLVLQGLDRFRELVRSRRVPAQSTSR